MEKSYFWTMSFLVLHQIDAAFWREWEMFLLPGGIQGYLAFNAVAIPILLLGYKHVVAASENAVFFAKLCAALGALTFFIHAGFALAGFGQFHLPVSVSLIVLCFIGALWLAVEIKRSGRGHQYA
ncbi:hypothetical protein QQM79_20665 [Marinobacteraceae bacterium S3BR75-40.1]